MFEDMYAYSLLSENIWNSCVHVPVEHTESLM